MDNKEYVLNTRTKKIHILSCDSVKKMSDKNKKIVETKLNELFKQKYTVCKRCRAGIKKKIFTECISKILYSNLYVENNIVLPSVEEYLLAVEEMSNWYVEHIPTYASIIQEEALYEYKGDIKSYVEYNLNNKNTNKVYNVISIKPKAMSIGELREGSNITRATESAIENYKMCFDKIDFEKNIAYYPCDLLVDSKDYYKPGDDCVRLLFAILNRMYSNYTKEYKKLSRNTYSNTNSKKLAININNIPYALSNLGFEVYDEKEVTVDINKDKIPDSYIYKIDDNFKLKKGDILSRKGHIHIYLGDGKTINAANFGWGRVYRNFPQYYNICVLKKDDSYVIELENSKNEKEYYTRVYRYIGSNVGEE